MDEAIPLRTFTAKPGQSGLGLAASASQPAITKTFVNFDPRGSNNRSDHEGSPVHLEPAYPGLSSEAEMHLPYSIRRRGLQFSKSDFTIRMVHY